MSQTIDATGHSETNVGYHERPDQSLRTRRAHEAAAHDAWFRAEVEAGIKEADDPTTPWIPHEEVMAKWFKRRAELTQTIKGHPEKPEQQAGAVSYSAYPKQETSA